MRSIDELDYYELLEISTVATTAEVDRAYRLAQQTYGEGSLALYSIFGSADTAAIRERLDEAYRVLSDPELRANYEVKVRGGDSNSSDQAEASQSLGPNHVESGSTTALDAASGPATVAVSNEEDEYDVFEDEGGGDFDGTRLRRTRLFRGYEIEDISDVTKVSGAHLRNIEDENFVELPADVYVRGFVTAYAKTIGLDPKIVVPSYMERLQTSKTGISRSRFLSRE